MTSTVASSWFPVLGSFPLPVHGYPFLIEAAVFVIWSSLGVGVYKGHVCTHLDSPHARTRTRTPQCP